jgi:hypothetical protein
MNENEFWSIIDNSIHASIEGNYEQVAFIKQRLIDMEACQIYSFEEILRLKLFECNDFKIMAAARIINDFISDDSYLYFRCWLISKGRSVFEEALKNPDSLVKYVGKEEIPDCEDLLYVATEAYSMNTGKEEDDTFPRATYIQKGLDYDIGAQPIKGKDWNEEELANICPNLFKSFQKKK